MKIEIEGRHLIISGAIVFAITLALVMPLQWSSASIIATNTVTAGAGAANGTITSNGNYDLVLQTGNASTSNITITDGANGNATFNMDGTGITEVVSTETGDTGATFSIYGNSASPAADDTIALLGFYGEDSAGNKEQYARIDSTSAVVTSASEQGTLNFSINRNGTLKQGGYFSNDGTSSILQIGDEASIGIVQSADEYDLVLRTGNATTGNITITDGANGNIALTSNGTGEIVVGNSSNPGAITTGGAQDLVLDTNSGTNSGNITITDGANGNVTVSPNGSGGLVLGTGDFTMSDGREVLAVDSLTCGASGAGLTIDLNVTQKGAIAVTQNADAGACAITFTNSISQPEYELVFFSFTYTGAGALTFTDSGGVDPNSALCAGAAVTESTDDEFYFTMMIQDEGTTQISPISCTFIEG